MPLNKIAIGFAGSVSLLCASAALAGDTTYVYDVHGQVIGVTRTTGTATYTYDNAGNRTQVTGPGGMALRAAPTSESLSATVDEELAQDVARANAQQASLKKLAPIAAPSSRNAYAPLPGVAAAISKAKKSAPAT